MDGYIYTIPVYICIHAHVQRCTHGNMDSMAETGSIKANDNIYIDACAPTDM